MSRRYPGQPLSISPPRMLLFAITSEGRFQSIGLRAEGVGFRDDMNLHKRAYI